MAHLGRRASGAVGLGLALAAEPLSVAPSLKTFIPEI